MADTKISQLPAVVAVSGTDEFAVNQAFVSKKLNTAQLSNYLTSSVSASAFQGQLPANRVAAGVFASGAYAFPSGFTQSSATDGFHNAGFTEWHELVAAPATPDATHIRIYSSDFHGFSTLDLLDSQGLIVKIGQDAFFTALNSTAVTLTKGTAVHITGSSGNSALVHMCIASASNHMPCDGIVAADIAAGAYGRIMLHGEIININTTAFGEGDTLYVSPTVEGGLTNIRPSFPNTAQQVGAVIVRSAGAGRILVDVHGFERFIVSGALAVSGTLITPIYDWGTVSASATFSFLSSSVQMVTLAAANATASFVNLQDGATITLQVFQDNGGNRSIGQWVPSIAFPRTGSFGGPSGTFSTGPQQMDYFTFTYNARKGKVFGRQVAIGFN